MVKQRWSLRQGVQDVDCVTHAQAFPKPAGARRPRMDAKALRVVSLSDRSEWIADYGSRRRHLRQQVAIRPPELERPVGSPRDLKALLVHRAVMSTTEHREVGQRRRAPVHPVAEVMPLAETDSATRKPAALVPMVERPPQSGGNRPGPCPDLHHAPGLIMAHHHPAGVARQAPGRFL